MYKSIYKYINMIYHKYDKEKYLLPNKQTSKQTNKKYALMQFHAI